jgi:hypothetical protein
VRTLATSVMAGFVVAVFVLLVPQSAVACDKCVQFFDDESCTTAGPGEIGNTICEVPEEASCCCKYKGETCTGGSGGSGSGGGTGGGGGNQCATTGFCPAECFSCGGGGGRPRI